MLQKISKAICDPIEAMFQCCRIVFAEYILTRVTVIRLGVLLQGVSRQKIERQTIIRMAAHFRREHLLKSTLAAWRLIAKRGARQLGKSSMSNRDGNGKRSPTQRARVRQRARRTGRSSQPLHGEAQRGGTTSQQDEISLHTIDVQDLATSMAIRAPRLEEMAARIHDVHAGVCYHLAIQLVCIFTFRSQ